MAQEAKPTIVVSHVLAMLERGDTREEIREHYGLSKADLTRLFKNPNLKNKKSRSKPGFILDDDISEEKKDDSGDSNQAEETPQAIGPGPVTRGTGDFRSPPAISDSAESEQGDVDGIPVR